MASPYFISIIINFNKVLIKLTVYLQLQEMIRPMAPSQSKAVKSANHTIIDYRNGKYQGTIQTQNRLPNGIGMFLGQDYHFVLGFWKNGRVQGECFIVYPNGNISFGAFSKGSPQEMTCFQLMNGKILYNFTNNNKEPFCLVDDSYNKLLTVVRMHKDSISQFFDSMNTKRLEMSTDQIKQRRGVFFRKKIQVVQEIRYQNDIQKWIKIEQCSKQIIKSQYKGYKSFLRFYFCNLPQSQIELTQTKQQIQLRFKKSSIICHLIQNNNNENTLRSKLIGYYDQNNRKMEIFRKNVPGIGKEIQEFCQNQSFNYTNKRSTEAKKKMANYLKKSTHFANIYIKSKQFQIIRDYFQSLNDIIENEISSKKAQNLLQLAYPSRQLSPVQREKYKEQFHNKKTNYQMQLSEVRNDVLNKLKKRKNSNYDRQKSLSRNKFIENSQFLYKNQLKSRYGEQKENYYSPQGLKALRYGQNSPNLKQKKYLIYAQKSPFRTSQYQQQKENKSRYYESPSKPKGKKYTYISNQKHNKSINALEEQYKYNKKHLTIDLYHSRSEYNAQQNKYSYHQRYQDLGHKNREKTSNLKQSIKYLAKDYEIINQRLTVQRQSSIKKGLESGISRDKKNNYQNSKSPKKYNYLRSPIISPTSQSNKGKKQWR